MARNDGGAAFPRPVSALTEADAVAGISADSQDGMTLRDWFAGKVLEGMAAHGSIKLPFTEGWEDGPPKAAALAYAFADAMIAERSY